MNQSVQSEFKVGSFKEAQDFQLRQALALTPMQRLLDLEATMQFNADAEELNPAIKCAAAQLRR